MASFTNISSYLATGSPVHALQSVLVVQTLLTAGMFMFISSAASACAPSPSSNFGARREHSGAPWVLGFHHLTPIAGICASAGAKATTSCANDPRQPHLGKKKLRQTCEQLKMSTRHWRESFEPSRTTTVRDADSNTISTRQGFLGDLTSSVAKSAVLGTTVAGAMATQPSATFSVAKDRRSIQDIKRDVEADFVTRRYYVTGNLTRSLYRPDCLFTDPTTRVASVEKYTDAVKVLFDPDNAQVDLLSLEIEDESHLFAKWRLQGYLKFPWHPYVAPYTGTTRYSVDSDGLIYDHAETWSISALDAAKATITPTAGPQARRTP